MIKVKISKNNYEYSIFLLYIVIGKRVNKFSKKIKIPNVIDKIVRILIEISLLLLGEFEKLPNEYL